MIEPHIVINERTLTVAQAMTLRVAAAAFAFELRENGLGDDEHGKQMTALYLARLNEIIGLMVGERREAGMKWISVKERLPDHKEWVLVYDGHWRGVAQRNADAFFKIEEWQDEATNYVMPSPTHWMPLPEPPEAE